MTGVIFKKVEIHEIAQYHKIRLDCLRNFPQNFGTRYIDEKKAANFKFDNIIAQQSGTDFLTGAFYNEELIGICGFIQEKREKTKHIGEISGMYVTPEFSGQKIGAELIATTIQFAFDNPDLEQIILAVVDKNQRAQNLYRKFGFVEYGRLNHYFKLDGEYETQVFMTLKRKQNKTMNR